jgi:cation:H+ antiporter
MPIWLHFLLCAASLAAVTFSADWMVMSSSRIARAWGVSELVIGLVLVGFGTSAPEMAASGTAALQGLSELSVANVIGSNIFNLCLILGICAAIVPLTVSPEVLKKDFPIMLAATALAVLLVGIDLELNRWEAGVLFGLLLVYLGARIRQDRNRAGGSIGERPRFRWRDLFVFIGALAILIASSKVMVDSSVEIARWMGISEWVIGVSIVAIGTSLPEFAASLIAALRGKQDISVGNLVGSNIFNLLGVLGLAGLLQELALSPSNRLAVLMIVPAMIMAGVTMWTGRRVSRFEGFVLVAVFAAFWLVGLVQTS